MSAAPRVSILLPMHNAARFLRPALDSILAQTFGDWELIVIDDASTDDSLSIVRDYDDNRLRLLRNENNVGIAASLNRGWDDARGELIARMDADDISLPERLAKQVSYMQAQPDVAVCGALALDIDEQGELVAPRIVPHGRFVQLFFWRPSPIIHPLAMIRNRAEWRYDAGVQTAQDFDLWLRIGRRHRLDNLPEVLLHYRVHPGSVSARRGSEQLQSCFSSFSRHVGGADYEEFLALNFVALRLSPLQRMRAMRRVVGALGQRYGYWHARDDLKYWRDWWRARRQAS